MTVNAWSRNVLKLSPATSSLNVSPNVNASPVCSVGTSLKLAVSGSDGGAATASVAALVRRSSWLASSVKLTRTFSLWPWSTATGV